MAQEVKAVRVRITGRVQGVSFRFWTRGEAERLGLGGYVRNEADGSVSALIVGSTGAVATMIDRLWHGPPGASVSGVETQEEELAESPKGFRITG